MTRPSNRSRPAGGSRACASAAPAEHSPYLAFPLLRQAPESREDGATGRLLGALGDAAAAAGASIGARPPALRDIVDALASGAPLPRRVLRFAHPAEGLQAALDAIFAGLYSVESHPRESRLQWRDALATAWIAAALARLTGGSPGTAGLAGLLHRVGEALALRAVVAVESAEGERFDPASRQGACAAFEPVSTAALLRAWRLPPGVSVAMQGWRRVGESRSQGAEARAVHFGHACASQLLFAEFPSPGLADQIGAELRLDHRETARLRATFGPLKSAVDSQLA